MKTMNFNWGRIRFSIWLKCKTSFDLSVEAQKLAAERAMKVIEMKVKDRRMSLANENIQNMLNKNSHEYEFDAVDYLPPFCKLNRIEIDFDLLF